MKKGTALTGIIAPEIRHLTTLKRLVIPSMNVGGKILEYIENFSSLVDLSISRCNFDGSFVETFGYYHPNLVTLDLAENGFSGPIPESFGRLVNLTLLDLSQNSFEGQIPSLLGQIPVLCK